MRLEAVRVRRWRNFIDSGWVPIDRAVTCLVGKNESGKSTFLEALYRLKPAYRHNSKVSIDLDYPRWRKVSDQRNEELGAVEYISARFLLEDEDLARLVEIVGAPIPSGTTVVVSRKYDGGRRVEFDVDEEAAVARLLEDARVAVQDPLPASSLDGLVTYVKESGRTDLKGVPSKAKKLQAFLARPPQEALDEAVSRMPTFFYFSDYSRLRGHVDLHHIMQTVEDDLDDHERTAKNLLDLVGVTGEEFATGEMERRIAELEAAAAEITQQVFKYWKQNRHLRVQLQTEDEVVTVQSHPVRQEVVHRFLDIRLLDQRHHVTTNFQTRSSGFRWFFSFIVAFNPFRDRRDVVVLLDEPGLSLHGRAQADFLRFVNDDLSASSQVFYTTHSPFLVDPSRLDRVRLVEDLTSKESPDLGAVVSDEAFSRDADTLFPLQAALGYDLAQNLFIGAAEHLVIEGTTDFTYLDVMSSHLKGEGREGLDERFSMVPVGGIANVPTFVALLGAHLDVSVLVDSTTKGIQRITNLVSKGLLKEERLVTIGDVLGASEADVEDLFEPSEYLSFYNGANGTNIKESELDGNGPILRQLERKLGQIDHGPPATWFLRNRDRVVASLKPPTLDRFEELFKKLNGTIPS